MKNIKDRVKSYEDACKELGGLAEYMGKNEEFLTLWEDFIV